MDLSAERVFEDADFFISRAGPDKEIAQLIGESLEAAGHKVIIQDWDFGDKSFVRSMDDALFAASRVIAVLSTVYLSRPHCKAEWQAALQQDSTNADGRLIVFRCDECAPQGLLGSIPYTDLVPVLADEGRLRERILAAVKARDRKAPGFTPGLVQNTITNLDAFETPHFSGRDEKIEDIRRGLTDVGHRGAVTGLAGIGKSALAREYARTFRSDYAGVWWVNAESVSDIASAFAQLAVRLEPHLAENTDQAALAKRAIERLNLWRPDRPWLLIFDNVEGPASLTGFQPEGDGAHVLLTSRFGAWPKEIHSIPLGPLPRQASIELLCKGAGRGDAHEADCLAETLGDHALALRHAGSYLRENAFETFAEYDANITRRLSEVPESEGMVRSVAGTMSAAIDSVSKRQAEALSVLQLLSHLNPDGVDVGVFAQPWAFYPEGMRTLAEDGESRKKALSLLLRYALLSVRQSPWGAREVSTHRLVQRIVREQNPDRDGEVARAAEELTLGAFRKSNRAQMQRTYFGGREDEMRAIERSLWMGKKPVAIVGSGGIGKSSAALEYASRARYRYSHFWWVPCDDRHDALTSLAQLGRLLFASTQSANLEDAAREAVLTLSARLSNERILLLYDNVASSSTLRGLVPFQAASAHIVATSRSSTWSADWDVVDVSPLSDADVGDLIRSLGAILDADELPKLARTLEGHALGARLAGSYLAANAQSKASEVAHDIAARLQVQSTRDVVSATLEITLARLSEVSPDGLEILRLISSLHPDRTPVEAVSLAFAHFIDAADRESSEDRFRHGFQHLVTYSLIRFDAGDPGGSRSRLTQQFTFMHRLVQAHVQLAVTDAHSIAAARSLGTLFPTNAQSPTQWDIAELLAPHLRRLVDRVPTPLWPEEALGAVDALGAYFAARAMIRDAERYLEKAYQSANEYSKDPERLAVTGNAWAAFLQAAGRGDQAESVLRAISIPVGGTGDVMLAANLSAQALEKGDIVLAESILTGALQRIDNRHRAFDSLRQRLAEVWLAAGRIPEAERLLRDVASSLQKQSDSPELSDAIASLAGAALREQRGAEAVRLAEQALEIDLKLFGENHPRSLGRAISLSEALLQAGDFARAHFVSRAAANRARADGGAALAIYGLIVSARAKYFMGDKEAAAEVRTNVDQARQILPVRSMDMAQTFEMAATFFAETSDFKEAAEHQRQAIEIYQHVRPAAVQSALASFNAYTHGLAASVREQRQVPPSTPVVALRAETRGQAIFVSHATRDSDLTRAIISWMSEQGFNDVFVDFSSIQSGENWQAALERAADACKVVVLIVTEAWLQSSFCRAEFLAAYQRGKPIIPLIAVDGLLEGEPGERLGELRNEYVAIELASLGAPSSFEPGRDPSLSEALVRSFALASGSDFLGRELRSELQPSEEASPYPGLRPYDGERAGLFFGREREILNATEVLRELRAAKGGTGLAIVGDAGSGKSSFIRAGIHPRLQNERGWAVLPAFSGADAHLIENLMGALAKYPTARSVNAAQGARQLLDAYAGGGSVLEVWSSVVAVIPGAADQTFLITIDDADWLLERGDPDALCLRSLLAELTAAGKALVLASLRTENLNGLEKSEWGISWRLSYLRRLPAFQVQDLIRQVADRRDIAWEPAFSDRLVSDYADAEDNIGLLAFTLRYFWDLGDNTRVRASVYEESGGLEGILVGAAESALRGLAAPMLSKVSEPIEEKRMQRFQHDIVPKLFRTSDAKVMSRSVDIVAQLSHEEYSLLEPFIAWGLLTRTGSTIEPASDLIAQKWPRLRVWLSEMLEQERASIAAEVTSRMHAARAKRKKSTLPTIILVAVVITVPLIGLAWAFGLLGRLIDGLSG